MVNGILRDLLLGRLAHYKNIEVGAVLIVSNVDPSISMCEREISE